MLSHAQDAPSPPPPSERFEGWSQALIFLVLMAGAGVFALMATRVEPPTEALDEKPPGSSEARSEVVLVAAAQPGRLLVLVESAESAVALELWRREKPVSDSGSFGAVEISGPLPPAALEEALAFANVACAQEGCEPVSVIDLQAGRAATR